MTAGSDIDERLLAEALAWHRALEGDDADWDAYVLWLEADPRHREASKEIAVTDRIVEGHREALAGLTAVGRSLDRSRTWFRRHFLQGVAAAAAIAIAVGIPLLNRHPAEETYATAAGEKRTIALANSATIDLAPVSQIKVKGSNTVNLELVRGEAFFSVVHDPARTLSIHAGDDTVADIGTRFAVNLTGEALLVRVSEGHVSIARDDGGTPVKLSAGQQLLARKQADVLDITPIAPEDAGSWRQGRLTYDHAPLSVVLSDISRYSGQEFIVDPSVRDMRFSGILVIGDGSQLLARLSEFVAVRYQTEGDRVRVSADPAR
jgi:transmembrane sensor